MNKLNKSIIYKEFKKVLIEKYGKKVTLEIWNDANKNLSELEEKYPEIIGDSKMMILPATALYKAMKKFDNENTLQVLKEYGNEVGTKISKIIHTLTSIPGIPKLLWKNMPKLMRKMSSQELGYTRKIVSETNELVAVDILACPLHDTAKKIGIEEIAQVVCAMDKAYMTGFKNINYTRTTSVAEGDRCCNYRLAYDKFKR